MSVLLVVLNPKFDQFPACCAGWELSSVLDADIKRRHGQILSCLFLGKMSKKGHWGVCSGVCSLLERGCESQAVRGNSNL